MVGAAPPRQRDNLDPLVDNPFQKHYLSTMKQVWHWIHDQYRPSAIWGSALQIVLWQSALRSHGDLPLGCAFLALAAAGSNGAVTELFGDSPTPLNYWVLDSNYPQIRKSEITKLLSSGCRILDTLIQEHFLEKWEEAVDHAEHEASARGEDFSIPEPPILHSIEIPSCTPEALFERLASDWNQIANARECKLTALGLSSENRQWYSMLLNDDEFYGKATDFKFCGGALPLH